MDEDEVEVFAFEQYKVMTDSWVKSKDGEFATLDFIKKVKQCRAVGAGRRVRRADVKDGRIYLSER
ncbi:hypothetical protein ACPRNU_23345 [Chromobacterium vaccinii]|uniref:hypothetical protein n=1 Tax=Chromobacterium vaccinii TaxID=1108595 RepID=UPI003C76803F